MDIHQLLIKYWGYSKFRPLQDEIIDSVMQGHDTLALLPTGGGKSVCYQIPALAMKGICIVVSPLISLIKDQVRQLESKKIPVAAIYSGMSYREIDKTLDLAVDGKVKFLYISPERLQTEIFRVRAVNMPVNLIAVDEAHCISQWGYDFRPSYLKISDIRDLLPQVPIIALTATATVDVRNDIVEKLKFYNGKIFIKSFERQNLSYSVLKEENKPGRIVSMLQKVNGSAIVFVNTRRKTAEVSNYINENKISSTFYHAGLEMSVRSQRQEQWIKSQIRVMVCTNAFGMGIDKPDVRLVVHMDPSAEIESYFQEAGRAGRDEKKSFAVCLYDDNNLLQLQERMKTQFPSTSEIKKVYQSLANYFQLAIAAGEGVSFDFDLTQFCKTYQLHTINTYYAIKVLEQEGYLLLSDAVSIPSRLIIKLNRDSLYRFELVQAAYEPIIKAILRLYGGVFDFYSIIKEHELAKFLNIEIYEVTRQLQYLHDADIIEYLPAKDKPLLTYLIARMDAQYLPLNDLFLEKRKKAYEIRLRAMNEYLETKWKCRSQTLLRYFGEDDAPRCGICDVCLRRHELDVSDIEFEKNIGLIKNLLSENDYSIIDIIKKLPALSDAVIIESVRWLMDTGLIEEDKKKILHWKK